MLSDCKSPKKWMKKGKDNLRKKKRIKKNKKKWKKRKNRWENWGKTKKGKIAEANMCLFSVETKLYWFNFVGYFCRTVNAVRLKIMCGPPIFSAPVRLWAHPGRNWQMEKKVSQRAFCNYKYCPFVKEWHDYLDNYCYTTVTMQNFLVKSCLL